MLVNFPQCSNLLRDRVLEYIFKLKTTAMETEQMAMLGQHSKLLDKPQCHNRQDKILVLIIRGRILRRIKVLNKNLFLTRLKILHLIPIRGMGLLHHMKHLDKILGINR